MILSPYAAAKLAGELYCQAFYQSHGLETVCLRYSNVFGPRQDPKSQYAAAIPAFISRAISGDQITIYGDGGQTRDFVFIDDVVRANLTAAGLLEQKGGGPPAGIAPVYNVGGGRSISILELAQKIVAMAGSSTSIVHGDPRAGDVRHSIADVSRIKNDLGFEAEVGLDDGLGRTVEYFRAL